MLELWRNGEKEILFPIDNKGKVGQTVIYGEKVDWGENPNPTLKPLSKYPYPSVFTIIKRINSNSAFLSGGYYILKDSMGEKIKLPVFYPSSGVNYLYDAQEWLHFNCLKENGKNSKSENEIDNLKSQIDLLKDILVKQGYRVITETQAQKLGIK